MMNNTIAVKTQGLKKYFGKIKALDGINLEVRKGTVIALLGPNGAGKTTFIRILATLMKPDGGWAKVSGYDVVQEAAKVRSVIGLTGQYAAVDENLTGAENLEMVGQLHHLRKADARSRAYDLLDVFDLKDASRRLVRTYSGGMRRRLDLAASLVARPPILFLDEPTAGLDPRSRLGLWDIITSLVEEGTTVFLTTQYLEEADRLADGIAVLDNGIIIKEGTSLELKGCCGGDVLVQLSLTDRAQIQTAAQILDDLGDGRLRIMDDIGRITLPLSGGTYMLPEIVRRLDTGHIAISDLSVRQPTLDDVFLALTGRSTEESTDVTHTTNGT
jgi:ABC-2 type transport system ATP-binding protein